MEIERKYLIDTLPEDYQDYPCRHIEQAYLNTDPVIRIRKDNNKYELTYKSKGLMAREEYNLPLDEASYQHLLTKIDGRLIRKKRYMIPYWRLKNSERTVTSGTGNIREYSKEADRNLRDLQTVQDNKIRTVQDLSSRLDELNQMTDSIRRELRAIQSSREDSETENVISEYLSIQSAFANAAVPIEMEGKFENRLDEIEENYPIEELIHQKESNSKKEKQLQKEIKNLQQASRRLSKLKKIQKR